MSQSANDWASPDPTKNIILEDADHFANDLACHLGIQFYDKFVRTTSGGIVLEMDLRHNQFMSPLPVNLMGHLSMAGSVEINIAEFRSRLRAAARSEQPLQQLQVELSNAVPGLPMANVLLDVPGVQDAIKGQLARV